MPMSSAGSRVCCKTLGDRQHKDGNRAFLQHGDEVRVDQRSRHAHCIQRGAAQLLGNTVGNKHRHEVERNVCQLAEQRIGRSILECRVCQRCQQQEHLEHTARNQTGDQRSDRCRNKTNHVVCNGLCTLLFGLARLLCRCFVRDNAARLICQRPHKSCWLLYTRGSRSCRTPSEVRRW